MTRAHAHVAHEEEQALRLLHQLARDGSEKAQAILNCLSPATKERREAS